MNTTAFRAVIAGAFVCLLCAYSFSARASERDRVLQICNSDFNLSLTSDCQCWADRFLELKAHMGEQWKHDTQSLGAPNLCRRMDNLSQIRASCMADPKLTNTTMERYCDCFADEMGKRQAASGKGKDSTDYSMSDAGFAQQTCAEKYLPETNDKRVSLKEKWDRRTVEEEYRGMFKEGYRVCTDYGMAPGQSAEKTKIRAYVNSFCPDIKDIMASVPTKEQKRILKDILKIEEKLYRTYKSEVGGIAGEWQTRLSHCEALERQCQQACEPNRAKTNRETCGCGLHLLVCLERTSVSLQ